jgi:hypothetical protein
MTTLVLNRTLKEVEWNDTHYPRPRVKKEIEAGCLAKNAVERNWNTKTTTEKEIVFASTLPDGADLYHKNYLGYLSRTFGHHNSIVLAPQQFWYTGLCEIAQTVVNEPETHRKLFTRDPEGKIDIIVPCADESEPLRMDEIYQEMIGLVTIDTTLFLPTFSTETEMSRMASLAAFLETCSPYYNYMMITCGHPRVKLLGTTEDWEAIVSRLDELEREFADCPSSPIPKWISGSMLPAATKLREALDGKNEDWFREIFTEQRCGSGGQKTVDGWFSRLFMKQPKGMREVTNFPTHVTKVPYKTLPSETEWNLCFGLFHSNRDDEGFMVPDFSRVQVKKLTEPRVTPYR